MGLKLVLDGATRLAPSVWSASLPPEDLAVLGGAATRVGPTSVILLPNLASPQEDSQELEFEPSQARILNAGATPRTIIVFGRETEDGDEDQVQHSVYGSRVQHDDSQFLSDLGHLPNDLATIGKEIFESLRSSHGGYFQRTRVGRFVNRPNNFWTVKIQPRDRSLRFTIRGEARRFAHIRGVAIGEDRNGYSTFKVSSVGQRDAAIAAIRAAATE